MKANVNPDLCIGCGICEQICEAVFKMDGDVAKTKGEDIPAEAEASCQEAAEACPVEAIAITE